MGNLCEHSTSSPACPPPPPPPPPPPSEPLKRRCCSSDSSSWPAEKTNEKKLEYFRVDFFLKKQTPPRNTRVFVSHAINTLKKAVRWKKLAAEIFYFIVSDMTHAHRCALKHSILYATRYIYFNTETELNPPRLQRTHQKMLHLMSVWPNQSSCQ